MNPQEELFHEDWRDALRHTVKALGGCEAVGVELFPNKTRKAAGNWISDCLNPERPAKLDLEDIEALLALAREHGIHTGFHVLADVSGYDRPKPSTPKSAETELLEKQAEYLKEAARIAREVDRLKAATELKAVK